MKQFLIGKNGICPKCESNEPPTITYEPPRMEYVPSEGPELHYVERAERMWVMCLCCSYRVAVSLDAGVSL